MGAYARCLEGNRNREEQEETERKKNREEGKAVGAGHSACRFSGKGKTTCYLKLLYLVLISTEKT